MIVPVQPFQPVVSPSPGAIAGWMSSNSPSLPHPTVAAGPPGFVPPSSAGKDLGNNIVCITLLALSGLMLGDFLMDYSCILEAPKDTDRYIRDGLSIS